MPTNRDARRPVRLAKLVVFLLLFWVPAQAQSSLPEIFLHPVVTDLQRVVGISHAGDGSGRLFLALQQGQVMVHDGEQVLETPFLDLGDRVTCCGENGLLSTAFHPDYETNGEFFVFYNDIEGAVVVSRFLVSADPNRADPDSEEVILHLDKLADNHNGGHLVFGPDGYLYVSLGDDGPSDDTNGNGQNRSTLFGSILRIDVDQGAPYSIPETNPFVDEPGARGEIWVYGLRNPWRFSFDSLTGDLFIGDVGQAQREEVDFVPAGASGHNFGWSRMEGSLCFKPAEGCNDGSLTLPILEEPHREEPCRASLIGGYRYRGSRSEPLAGLYIYADFCKGLIYGATDSGGTWMKVGEQPTGLFITTMGEDEAGELYLADLRTPGVFRLSTDPLPPSIHLLSPASAVAGGPDTEVAVSGFNFLPETTVQWNGEPRETQYIHERRLSFAVPAEDLVPGSAAVTVRNAGQKDEVSSPVAFTIHSAPDAEPVFTAANLVEGAAFTVGRPVSPGAIATLFGLDLAVETEAVVLAPPLPVALAGTRVLLDGVAVPQYYVSPVQINFFVPWELAGRNEVDLAVQIGALVSDSVTVPLAGLTPALLRMNEEGQGAVMLTQGLSSGMIAAPPSFPVPARPARRGEYVAIWGIGLGPVTNTPVSGAGAGIPLSETTAAPQVHIGSAAATVVFSGLAPGMVGLYQVNVQVPEAAPSGDAVPLRLTIGGEDSNTVTMAVE